MDLMTQEEANSSLVRGEIFGQAFELLGDLDYIQKLAEYVGFHMRAIRDQTVGPARDQDPTADRPASPTWPCARH